MFTIDGEHYDVGIVTLQRSMKKTYKYQVITQDGIQRSELKSLYPVYAMVIGPINQSEYDRLYDAVNQRAIPRLVSLPYNQETITFQAEIDVGQDGILCIERDGTLCWDGLTITFTGVEPLEV